MQVVDYNGIAQTISDPKRLIVFESKDPFESHEYRQVARHYRRTKKGDLFSILTSYYPNSSIFQYLEVRNGRAYGRYKEWHPNGMIHLDCHVLGGIPELRSEFQESWEFDDICQSWDEHGNLEARIPYIKGVREGESISYYPNGCIQQIIPFKNDLMHGTKRTYTLSSELSEEATYEEGLLNGKSFFYSIDGALLVEEFFDRGLLVEASYFDLDGILVGSVVNGNGLRIVFEDCHIVEKQEFVDGVQDGKIFFFNERGHLVRLATYKDGLLHGEDEHFFTPQVGDQPDPPIRKSRIQWYRDEIRGEVEHWYRNGSLFSSGTILDGEKDGAFNCYYPNGSISLLEEYEKGVLKNGRYFRMKDRMLVSSVENGDGTVTLFDENGVLQNRINYKGGHPVIEEESDNMNNP